MTDSNVATLSFEDFAKLCKDLGPFLPTTSRSPCHAYEVPGDIILLHVMLKPYFESKKMATSDEDLIIASYPKTGATLVQEICLLLQQISSGSDNLPASPPPPSSASRRFTLIEGPTNGINSVDNISGPRFMKTHLPYSLLPQSVIEKQCKIIYVGRNPKDTLVSYYHFFKNTNLISYSGTMSDFLELFLDNKSKNLPLNVLEYWEKRNEANILFVTYEDINKDLCSYIRSIAAFMKISITEAQAKNVAQVLCFDKNIGHKVENDAFEMNRRSFISKESIGEWKNHFNEEMNRKMDKYIKDHFENSGCHFVYEL